MIYFLIVVSVGGTTTITGPLLAALLLGMADVMGKYYVPKLGAFIVYTLMIVILLWRPQGLFAPRGADEGAAMNPAGAAPAEATVSAAMADRRGWRWWEFALLAAPVLQLVPAAAIRADRQRDRDLRACSRSRST